MSRTLARHFLLSSWNVRGLGDDSKCCDVKANLIGRGLHVICLQETKLQDITPLKASSFLPPGFSSSFVLKPSAGASGGILSAWDSSSLRLVTCTKRAYSLTTTFEFTADSSRFAVTNVYAPCDDHL